MAVSMFRIKMVDFGAKRNAPHSSVVAGLATTASSPYFFLWWATVGAALLASAQDFGSAGVAVMGVTHWICDLGWLFLISWVVYKSKQLWTHRVHRAVFGVCAAVLAGFGGWFIYSGIDLAISA
jgi:threonine/homoserine/homoserine lactone efflux protein